MGWGGGGGSLRGGAAAWGNKEKGTLFSMTACAVRFYL